MSHITGREPRLSRGSVDRGTRRLLPRRFASLLNTLQPDAVSLEAVAAALRSDEFFVRYNAGKLLARRADRPARLLCEDVLQNGDLLARATVARYLYGFSWFAAEPLFRRALKDPEARVRESAVYALCEMGGLNAYRLLAKHLPGEPDNVLEAAAVGLRDRQDGAVVPVLQAVLMARDSDVRVKGLEALAATETDEAVPLALDALRDPSPAVRYAATLSYLELLREDGLPRLAAIIQGETSVMRLYILQGLFHASNYLGLDLAAHANDLLAALGVALADDLPETRLAAVWPLAWLRHPQGDDLLLRAYQQEQDSVTKAEMVRIIVKLMSAISETILADAMQSTDDRVRQAAESILARRAATGIVLTYDETAGEGTGLAHPQLGR